MTFVPYIDHSIQVVRQDVLWQAVLPTLTGTSLFSWLRVVRTIWTIHGSSGKGSTDDSSQRSRANICGRPGIYPRNMKLDSKTASFYHSRPSKWLSGRKAIVPVANILGGGSSINFVCVTCRPFSASMLINARWCIPVPQPQTTMIFKLRGGALRS